VPFTLLGAGLLWFGWFGFNAGSALAANKLAALAFVNTLLAPSAALTVWILLDLARTGRATAVGAATGIVVGLVAVTPAAGFVGPMAALAIGAIAAVPSHFAIVLRSRTSLDDSLDVVAAHGLGGMTGALLTGVFADQAWNGTVNGLLHGNPRQLGIQAVAVLATAAFSAGGTYVVLQLVALVARLRVTLRDEGVGLDVSQHGEEAYTTGDGAILVMPRDPAPAPVRGSSLVAEGGRS
jgi:Amt family ammonium transporter